MSAREWWGHVADVVGRLMFSTGVLMCVTGVYLCLRDPVYIGLLTIGSPCLCAGIAWGEVAQYAWTPDDTSEN